MSKMHCSEFKSSSHEESISYLNRFLHCKSKTAKSHAPFPSFDGIRFNVCLASVFHPPVELCLCGAFTR